MKRRKLLGALCASMMALLVFSGHASAASLDFNISTPTPGTLSYAGGSAPLIGSGIEVDNVVGLGTPSNSNVISTCVSCRLDFTSGGSTGGWVFGSGGTISITGGIDFTDSTPDIAAGSLLLSGTFDSAQIFSLSSGTFQFTILGASFSDTKNPALLAFYGLPDVLYTGGLNLSFSTDATMGVDFTTSSLGSGGITNQAVPVPAALWLFGSGLVGLAGLARRKV